MHPIRAQKAKVNIEQSAFVLVGKGYALHGLGASSQKKGTIEKLQLKMLTLVPTHAQHTSTKGMKALCPMVALICPHDNGISDQ